MNTTGLEVDGETNLNKCERVKARIDAYLTLNPRLSLQNVEDKTSVPYSTLRRITNLNGNPQPEAVIKIYQALGYDQELYQYMLDFHPDIAGVMAMKTDHNKEYQYIRDEDREYFISEDYFLIINLASSTSGTSIDEIQHELGTKGVERLQELIKKDLIKKNEANKFVLAIDNYKLSFADTKKGIEMALRYYRLEEAGNINNWMSLQTEGLNKEGLKAAKILYQKQFNERKETYNNPMYKGDIKVYSATVSSTFLSYDDRGDLQ